MYYHIAANRAITFGKFRGLTGRQLAQSAKGTHYLQWAEGQGISIEPGLLGSAKESNEANHVRGLEQKEIYEEASAHEKYHANRTGED